MAKESKQIVEPTKRKYAPKKSTKRNKRKSKSVFTVSGGLPSLGKKR